MAWDFETEPDFQLHLNWMKEFIHDEIRPLDLILGNPYDKSDLKSQEIAAPLKDKVKETPICERRIPPNSPPNKGDAGAKPGQPRPTAPPGDRLAWLGNRTACIR